MFIYCIGICAYAYINISNNIKEVGFLRPLLTNIELDYSCFFLLRTNMNPTAEINKIDEIVTIAIAVMLLLIFIVLLELLMWTYVF